MELKLKWFKSMNDFFAVIIMGSLGLFLCISDKIIQGGLPDLPAAGGILVRADMYIRLIGGIFILLSALLFLKNLSFSKSVETKALVFPVTSQGVLTLVSLIVYTLLLRIIGFALDTFLLSFFLVFLYMKKENADKIITRPILMRMIILSTVFSLVLVGVVYVIFGLVLYVSLP